MLLSFNFGMLASILVGIFIGFLLSTLIYLKRIKHSFKKQSKTNYELLDNKKTKLSEPEKVEEIISSYKKAFFKESKKSPIGDKFLFIKDNILDYATDIANVYYPKSKYPLYEISFSEAIDLVYYLNKRIDSFFKASKITSTVRTLQIKKIKDYSVKGLDIVKSDTVKTAKGIMKVVKVFKNILNIFNPVYWSNKIIMKVATKKGVDASFDILIELIGVETAKVYSKSFKNEYNEE